jgi:CRP/FNR family cyclic AMP-dependent transcriptional regulator
MPENPGLYKIYFEQDEEKMARLDAIKSSPLFKGMSQEDIAYLAPLFTEKAMSEGAIVFVENMPGESLFLVMKGAIKISKMIAEGEEKILVILGAEDFFGEMALLEKERRSATARVAEDAELLSLKKSNFDALCESNPRLALKLLRNITLMFQRRVRESEDEYRDMLLWSMGNKP